MRRSAAVCTLLLCLLTFVPLHSGNASERDAAFDVEPLLLERVPFTDAGVYLLQGAFEIRSLNNNGQLGLSGYFSDGNEQFDALYIVSETAVTEVDRATRDQRFDESDLTYSRLSLNDAGQAAFKRTHSVVDEPITETCELFAGGENHVLVRTGDVVDGFVAAGTGMTSVPALNSRGEVAVVLQTAFIPDPQTQPLGGVFVASVDGVRSVALPGAVCEDGGSFGSAFAYDAVVTINSKGEVLFNGAQHDAPRGASNSFVAGPDGVRPVPIGRKIPGTDLHMRKLFYAPGTMNDAGTAAFLATITDRASRLAIVKTDDDVAFGTVARGTGRTPFGGRWNLAVKYKDVTGSYDYAPSINAAGDVAFKALVRANDGTEVAGIFLATATGIVRVVAEGDPLPAGGTVQRLTSFSLNDRGQVAFYAVGQGAFLATPRAPAR